MMKRRLVSFVVLALVLALTAMPALAASEGSSSGSFSAANSNPTVDTVALWTTGGTPAATTTMTPQVEFNAKVTVTDANTLDDLSTVKVTIFYDADGIYNVLDIPSVGNTQTAAILTWTNLVTDTWEIDAISGGGSWSIVSANCVVPTITDSTGTFEFHFIPGKVATETDVTSRWHIYAKADDGTATDDNYQDNRNMNWYGEILVNTPSVAWGSVAPGTDFGVSTQQTASVTYKANGAYDEKVAASSSWTGIPSGTATLNEAGAPSTGSTMGQTLVSAVLRTGQSVPITVALIAVGVNTAVKWFFPLARVVVGARMINTMARASRLIHGNNVFFISHSPLFLYIYVSFHTHIAIISHPRCKSIQPSIDFSTTSQVL